LHFIHYSRFVDLLKCESEDVSDTPFMAGGEVEIIQTSHKVYVDYLEDIVHSNDEFDVGLVVVHNITAIGEVHQAVATRILGQEGVVLVGKIAPQRVDGNILAPFQLLQ